jgi:hypothetical protein
MAVMRSARLLSAAVLFGAAGLATRSAEATKLPVNHPGLLQDVAVGLWGWPLPMDYNGDGLPDLVMVCCGRPSNGVWFFENTGTVDPDSHLPIFKPGVRIGPAPKDTDSPQISYDNGRPIVTTPGNRYPDFLHSAFAHPVPIVAPTPIFRGHTPIANPTWPNDIRAYEWKYCDYYGSGKLDLIAGLDYWGDYNWEGSHRRMEAAYDARGRWKYGPLHGYVYVLRNLGTNEHPRYAPAEQVMAGDGPVDVYGTPSPCFGDFRGVGKLDLICGEFLEGFTYYENIGTRTHPKYAPGRPLTAAGIPIRCEANMITPTACDFFGRGHLDIISCEEDGRVCLIENTGRVADGMPQFLPPRYFRQQADKLKLGALSAPSAADLYGTGREDLVVGDAMGYIGVFRNLGGNPPSWAAPVLLTAGGKTIHIVAGYNGDCQGPSEVNWGYTNPRAVDWDGDGRVDILCSDVWGKVYWYRNIGTRTEPRFAAAQPIEVDWPGPAPKPSWNWWNPAGKELVTQWRCSPCAIDWNQDGLMDLVMVDPEGYLALYQRTRAPDGRLHLLPPKRIFRGEGVSWFGSHGQPLNHESGLLRLNAEPGGSSGRRTYCFMDWDGDGTLDLMVNSWPNINFLKGMGRNASGYWVFKDMGPVTTQQLARHSTCATPVHWADPKRADLLFGAEDGFFYFLAHP